MSWEADWERQERATRDPRSLLSQVDRWTKNALESASSSEEQKTAEIMAQVAIAKAVAALASAVLRLGPSDGESDGDPSNDQE
jgi:hypothetical protein